MQSNFNELEGGPLDVAVAHALGLKVEPHPSVDDWWLVFNVQRGGWDTIMDVADEMDATAWSPSTKWEHGGPIIQREKIILLPPEMEGDTIWSAGAEYSYDWEMKGEQDGPTALVAAMRCFAAKKLGPVMEILTERGYERLLADPQFIMVTGWVTTAEVASDPCMPSFSALLAAHGKQAQFRINGHSVVMCTVEMSESPLLEAGKAAFHRLKLT